MLSVQGLAFLPRPPSGWKGDSVMKKINLAQASALTSSNPVTVVCTERPDGGANLAAVSWWTL